MVEFPPLMPSARWFATFLQAYAKGMTVSDSIIFANSDLSSSRDFGRFLILGSQCSPVTLSVAVEGGGRQLRYPDKIMELKLSEHGDWRKNHLKAMEACLGRKPYFPYIFPYLSGIYLDKNLQTLQDFNNEIFKFLFKFILGNINNSEISRFYNNEILGKRGQEVSSDINPEISIFEVISNFGKESLIGFLAMK
ncbi:MAG: WbqC family protein [Muribaculaceae bacterium]|nr:WbqC family protein [Muribaculaceae bacterium]